MEDYRPIKHYESLYYVSNIGNVKNIKRNTILKPGTTKENYKFVILCDYGIKQVSYIHRLVAEAFIPNPDNKPFVDHINNNPADNSLENLRWATKSENQYNRKDISKSQTGIKNVRPARNGKFRVYCSFNKCGMYVGQYESLESAIEAYNSKVKELHGSFAKLISKEL